MISNIRLSSSNERVCLRVYVRHLFVHVYILTIFSYIGPCHTVMDRPWSKSATPVDRLT